MDQVLNTQQNDDNVSDEADMVDRRRFLLGLGKWSLAVIGGALLAGSMPASVREAHGAAWANRVGAGGAWANRAGGGGAVVVAPGGGAWANRVGPGGAWANRGAAWANRGAAWVNRF